MNEHRLGRRRYRSNLVSRIFLQYLLALVGYVAAALALTMLGWNIVHSITWQPKDPMYIALSWARDNLVLVAIVVGVVGWSGITFLFLARPFRYLDEIITAAERLASPTDAPISLPPALSDVEDEMNLIRTQSLRSAELAREAEQRKNDLIVYLAHDLKTPLTSVIGYLTLLRDEPQISTEMRARYTGVALDKALRLEDLVNEFFDITRFNLTALTLETERMNLSRMLEQMAFEFQPVMAEKALTWRLDVEGEMMISCDPDKMARVFDNLMRNAVNYSDPNTEIALSAHAEAGEARIEICNHGRTIPPEKLAHIFEQFFRLDASRSTATGGAGLGLAIAREIVELHGGTIAAESEHETICFRVALPLDRQEIVRKSEE